MQKIIGYSTNKEQLDALDLKQVELVALQSVEAFHQHMVEDEDDTLLLVDLKTLRIMYLETLNSNKIMVKTKSGIRSVEIDTILYAENDSRCVSYHLIDGSKVVSVSTRKSFEESVGTLNGHPFFVQPHKSFFVNMNHVVSFGQTSLEMKNGDVLPISRQRLIAVRKNYCDYLE